MNKFLHYSVMLLAWMPVLASSGRGADFHSPRTASLGGAGHAAPLLNDSLYLNPSFSAFLPSYSISGAYVSLDPGRNYNFALQDGRTEIFQAGVGYTVREDGKFIHVGASKSVVKRTGFGIGAKFYFGSDTHENGSDFTASVTGVVSEFIQVAMIADNLKESDAGKSRGLYREFILGTKVNIQKIVMIYFDPQLVPNHPDGRSYGHSAGLEFGFFRDFFWRVGNFRNTQVPWLARFGKGWATGAGWVGPRFSVDYSVTRVLEPALETAHSFGLTLYF